MSTPESKIQTTICRELRKRGLFFFRVNNMPVYDPKLRCYRSQGEFALNGVPDIIMIAPTGRFIGMEVKTDKGNLSTDQILFQKRLERNNGLYCVVRSVADMEDCLGRVDK